MISSNFFFNKILFITGICLIIGLERTIKFFFGPLKLKGSLFFFGGVFIVLFGWPLVGMLVEIYGFIALFGYIFSYSHFSTNIRLNHILYIINQWIFTGRSQFSQTHSIPRHTSFSARNQAGFYPILSFSFKLLIFNIIFNFFSRLWTKSEMVVRLFN